MTYHMSHPVLHLKRHHMLHHMRHRMLHFMLHHMLHHIFHHMLNNTFCHFFCQTPRGGIAFSFSRGGMHASRCMHGYGQLRALPAPLHAFIAMKHPPSILLHLLHVALAALMPVGSTQLRSTPLGSTWLHSQRIATLRWLPSRNDELATCATP